MTTEGCYRDVLQWHDVGTLHNGCKILYKRNFGVEQQYNTQAEFDVSLNRCFHCACEAGYVLVIDVKHVRSFQNAVKYVRRMNELSDSAFNPNKVYVINTSKTVQTLWKIVRNCLDSGNISLVTFDHIASNQFSSKAVEQKYDSLCKIKPINK